MGDITTGLDASGYPIFTVGGVSQIDPASVCMPQDFVGPLAVGQQYCTALPSSALGGAAGIPATPAVCPAGSTCSIIPGIPNTSIYLGIAAVVSLFVMATAFGGRR